MAKRRAQIMRDGIGKRFQFLVAGVECGGPPHEFAIKFTDLLVSQLALFHLKLKVIACRAKIRLDSAPNIDERSNDDRPRDKKSKARQVSAGYFEAVEGLRKEVGVACAGQH